MVAPIRFLSGRQQQQKIGIEGSTENQKVLEVIGQVGIGTTIFEPLEQLDVRGSVSVADTITASTINATTVVVTGTGNTFSDLTVTGIATFGGNIDANAGLDVDGLTDLDELNVAGVATFASNLDINASVDISTDLTVDGLSDLDELNVAGISTFGSDVDINASVDISNNLSVDGLSDLDELNVAGVATFASDLDINADVDITGFAAFNGSVDIGQNFEVNGISTLGSSGGITTTGGDLFVGTDLSVFGEAVVGNGVTINASGIDISGIVTASNGFRGELTGNVTGNVTGTASTAIQLETARNFSVSGDVATDPFSPVSFNGTSNVDLAVTLSNNFSANTSGIITSSGGFVGDISGDLTGVASTATKLQNARDFSITGDFVTASAVSFDGTGNVALGATITADSITLGTYTSGDYVESITGTSNQVTVTGGTGESSTPQIGLPNDVTIGQDLTISRDLQVNRNVTIDGAITVGGTSATLFTQTLQVADADLILGVRTDAFGNDISTDNTANHGGIAIASTEGNPLVVLTNTGAGETLPSTYKKIMWFKSGSFSGLGTDAWISNYAVGIGSTQFPTGTRLAAGNVQVTLDDISVVRNINASGIITGTLDNTLTLATSGNGISGSATYDNSGAVTFTVTSDATDANTAETIVHRDASGNFSAGTITANLTGNVTGNLTGVASTATKLETARDFSVSGDVATASAVSFNGTGNVDLAVTLSNSFDANTSGIITSTGGFVGNLTGTATTATNLADGANITTGTISDDRLPDIITSNINVTSGISTVNQVIVGSAVTINSSGIDAPTGIVTALQFVGTASTASFATTAFTLNGTSEGGLSVGTAVTATNIAGGDTGDIPYQSAANTTTFVDASSASVNQVLLWNGSSPEWANVTSASGAFGGVTIKDEGSTVGTAGSVSTLNFVGSNIEATATTGANGISTITLSDTPTFTELTVTGITSVSNFEVSGVSTFSADVHVGSAITMQASTGIISATAFYGSGQNLTDLINQRIEGIRVFEESTAVGTGYSISALQFIGDNVTATAVGLGTTVAITFSDAPNFDSVNVTGIVTANSFIGDGSGLTGVSAGTTPTENTTNQSQFIPFYVSTASTDVAGISTQSFVFNPSTTRMGIGTDSPQATLHVVDEFLVSTAGAASTQRITQKAYTTDNGTLSWEGSAGQLFSVTNNLTSGSIFSVNDVSGIPSIDVDADGTIQLAPYGSTEFVGIGTTNPTSKLHVVGDARVSGAVTATSFTGDGSGLTNLPVGAATSITLADESSDTTCFPIFATDATGDQAPKTDSSALTYNASTGALSATIFSGNATSATFATTAGVSTNVEGTANRVLYNSATDTTTTSANLTFDGDVLGVGGTVTANRYRITSGNNLFVGNNVGVAITLGMTVNPVIAFGYNSLRYFEATGSGGGSNTCQPQIAIGYGCMENFEFDTLGNGSRTFGTNIVMGYESGRTLQRLSNSSTAQNVIFGYQNVYQNNFGSASNNSVFGVQSGYKLTNSNGNALYGYQSGYEITSGGYNTLLGYQAGYSVQTGQYNIGIGYSAGQVNMTGSRNIVIGYNRDVPNAAGNDQLVIGSNANDWIIGDSSYNVGIGTDAIDTAVKLTVGGAVTATTYYGDGSNLIGISAGHTPTENTTNQSQYVAFYVGTSATTTAGVSTESFVFNPSTKRMGIGTDAPAYNLHVVGDFAATSKSFVIDHPTKSGKKLRYASLEGPEQGVYVRGRSQEAVIDLPDYWTGLVDEETITVNLTPIGHSAAPRVESIVNNAVNVFSKEEGELDYYYTVYAERKDIEKLVVEY